MTSANWGNCDDFKFAVVRYTRINPSGLYLFILDSFGQDLSRGAQHYQCYPNRPVPERRLARAYVCKCSSFYELHFDDFDQKKKKPLRRPPPYRVSMLPWKIASVTLVLNTLRTFNANRTVQWKQTVK